MQSFRALNELSPQDLQGKRVFFRVDYNVPIKEGVIQDETRIRTSLASLRFMIEAGAKIIVATHMGRPKGQVVEDLRTNVLAERLSELNGIPVQKLDACVGELVQSAVSAMKNGSVLMLENLRFHEEEKANDPSFAAQLAELADLYVSDAFGVSHRDHASVTGVAKRLPSYAGFLLAREIRTLSEVLESPAKPLCMMVGGAKIDTKIGILERFVGKADFFLIGGAMANTFLAAQGKAVGASLFQEDKLDVARDFLKRAEESGTRVLLPSDLVVSQDISEDAEARIVNTDSVEDADKILDIGPASVKAYSKAIGSAATVLWNGPMGIYEFPPFAGGTRGVMEALAQSNAKSIVGGGDSLDAIAKMGRSSEEFTHLSTGGGAMLEFLEGKVLPGIQVLQKEV